MQDVASTSAPVALVTGASRGIGRAIAQQLLKAGYRVAITARPSEQLEATGRELRALGEVLTLGEDLRDPDAPDRILAAVEAEFGPPTVLVNNAGTAPSAKLESTSDADLEATLDLHVKAPFRLLRRALPAMRKLPGSCAVQVASTAGLVGFPFTSAYTAAKHGMVGLTRALAAELGDRPPRCYALCPGFVETDITAQAAADIAARGKQSQEQAMAALGAMNAIGRMHTVDEVAAAVARLVRERPAGCVYNLDADPPGFV